MEPLLATLEDGLLLARDALDPDLLRAVRQRFEHPNPELGRRLAMGRSPYGLPRTISLLSYPAGPGGERRLRAPRGAVAAVRELARLHGRELRVRDARPRAPLPAPLPLHGWTRSALQARAAWALLRAGGGVLVAPCGSGKTEVLLLVARALRQRTLVLVPHGRAFAVWRARAAARFGLREGVELGLWGGGKRREGTVLTVMTQQAAWRLPPAAWAALAGGYGTLLVDEVHHAAASTFYGPIDTFPGRYVYGATAGLRRADGLNWIVEDILGPVAFTISEADLRDAGRAQAVDCYLIPTAFEYDLNNRAELAAAVQAGELRVPEDAGREERARLEEEYLRAAGSAPRDWTAYVAAATRDPGRLALLRWAVDRERAAGRSLLVLVQRRALAQGLYRYYRARGPTGLCIGGTGRWRAAAAAAEQGLGEGSLPLVIGTTAADEALDAPPLEVVLRTHPVGKRGFGAVQQQAGRTKRPGEGKLSRYYYLWDYRVDPQLALLPLFREEFGSVTIARHAGVDGKDVERRVRQLGRRHRLPGAVSYVDW